ncbi:MAG: DEAD/DEAH box helicase family protein [Gallionella sp.]
MSTPSTKRYQSEAVNNILELFRHAEAQIQAANDSASRAAATAYNGCALLEAPTGSGKTLMAGLIAEAFSRAEDPRNAKVVWFWFTPFASLVEQSKAAFKEHFTGLRVRDLLCERVTAAARSGDVFVTTWASVATAKQESRIVRTSGDVSVSLDEFIGELREEGFRIGVVVDEAHNNFTSKNETEALRFYRDVMRPDFTLLITATPDDKDIDKFKNSTGIAELHRVSVSRHDAVEAGLIKDGIKSIVYIAPDVQKDLPDFALTAIIDAWQMHSAIKLKLMNVGIRLIPLLLVQVGNSDTAVDEAKLRLIEAGVPEGVIKSYTSKEPEANLLVVAKDEAIEVLIFKVAVALGFDAPRAFTLVSMRGAQDTDFGIQVVGRILRVHRRLQAKVLNKTLPEILRYGYVFLANAENQVGLTSAGDKINSIKTELSKVSPFTMIVSVAGQNEVQVTRNGQTELLSLPYTPPTWGETSSTEVAARTLTSPSLTPTGILTNLILNPPPSPQDQVNGTAGKVPLLLSGNKSYPVREGITLVHKTERSPLATDDLLKCIQRTIDINDQVINAGRRKSIQVTRTTINIFDSEMDREVEKVQARLSKLEIARRAQGVLFDAKNLHPQELYQTLIGRLRKEYEVRGFDDADDELESALNLILATFPSLVRKAARQCAANHKEVLDTCALPSAVEYPHGTRKSTLNIYGVMPQDLNEHERKFAEQLDADTSGTVEYWFRNEPKKPWSIGIVMPKGDRYFPDFTIKVKDRARGGGIVLVEIKGNHILNSDDSLDKVVAEHKVYGAPIMLVLDNSGRFMTVRYNEKTDKNEEDQIFRIENLG